MLLAFNVEQFCTDTANLLQFVGWALLIFKIAIPFVIIGLGMIDFGKAVVSEKDDDIKKSAKTLLRRAVAGIVIFFIPSIVVWFFAQVANYSTDSEGFDNCQTCLIHPNKCKTSELA